MLMKHNTALKKHLLRRTRIPFFSFSILKRESFSSLYSLQFCVLSLFPTVHIQIQAITTAERSYLIIVQIFSFSLNFFSD